MWAIDKACMAYRRGEAGDGHFAPTPAEIRRYAKIFTRRFDDELTKIEKVLTARVIPAPRFFLMGAVTDKARAVGELIAAAGKKAEMACAGKTLDRAPPPEAPEQTIARYLAGLPPVTLSPEAQARAPFHGVDMEENHG